ncbi:MAG TPA: PCRF domain-containing protein, partial [Gemmatimonadota bacterium]|nr:PCRF domain-containing protein [Gemmatimonadota bacterium]
MDLHPRVAELRARFAEVETALADPGVARDPERLREMGREHSQLAPVVAAAAKWETARRHLDEDREMLRESTDPDLRELARAEIPGLEADVERLEDELKRLLLPRDPLDEKDAVLEIRAGTGGEEAALFAGDLFRMYSRYAERRGWRVEIIDLSPSDTGGIREAVAIVHGEGA